VFDTDVARCLPNLPGVVSVFADSLSVAPKVSDGCNETIGIVAERTKPGIARKAQKRSDLIRLVAMVYL